MSDHIHAPTIFNIPAGIAFAKSIASALIAKTQDDPQSLAHFKILLPTRRACRVMQDAFLDTSGGKPIILPTLQPIGDIDEEELSLSLLRLNAHEDILKLPPAMPRLKRQIMLAKLIMAVPNFSQDFEQALMLANGLGQFIDQVYTENLKMSDLQDIVPEEFAEHWKITLQFLKIISHEWPKILNEINYIDYADRRNKLIKNLCLYWKKNSSNDFVIAAGTTGSIPAVAQLLSTVSRMKNGCVILPGLDQDLDKESWNALDETHPQYGFRQLLEHMDAAREDVQLWPHIPASYTHLSHARRAFACEIMRPAETTAHWAHLSAGSNTHTNIKKALQDLHIFNCAHEREEAQTIALLMRETLETSDKTATLITSDQNLAARVEHACKRWGISIDNSAGSSLRQSENAIFMQLITNTCKEHLSPSTLLALLKHKLFGHNDRAALQKLEITLLRGPKPAPGFKSLHKILEQQANMNDDSIKPLQTILMTLEEDIAPLYNMRTGEHTFKALLSAHIEVAEKICCKEQTLWKNDNGKALSEFISNLFIESDNIPNISIHTYHNMIFEMMNKTPIRTRFGHHPRLRILGQIEARLIDAHLVIMGGLNEGNWPKDSQHDPWMSRGMRKDFGLPVHERSIGLAAHDFVQGFCAENVVITRSIRAARTPTIPARWLQRLDTVLEAANIPNTLDQVPHLSWAKNIDSHPHKIHPIPRPEPTPPINSRPKSLSATKIETWRQDPYGIYARYILKLKKLDPIEQNVDAAQRGSILHDTLDRFVTLHPRDLPANSTNILRDLAADELLKYHNDPQDWQFWWARFDHMSAWYIAHEKHWRIHAKPIATEAWGEIELHNFKITARADRIDQSAEGLSIIDYKSAGSFTKKAIETGAAAQLPVEALIASKGGFKDVQRAHIHSLEYWIIKGSASTPGSIIATSKKMDEILNCTYNGLSTLIQTFNDPKTPYYSVPNTDNMPRFNDYEHLARIQEWSSEGGHLEEAIPS